LGGVSWWVGGGGADEGLEEGNVEVVVCVNGCNELGFVTFLHFEDFKEVQ
jgi:hypothetical protein